MDKNNILDIGVATIRMSGVTNMFDVSAVQYYAMKMGFYELVSFIQEENKSAIELFSSIDYDKCPVADWEYLLDFDNDFVAREALKDEYSDEMKAYRSNHSEFLPLPFTSEEHSKQSNSVIVSILENSKTKHPLSHTINIKEYKVVWFKDGFYIKDAETRTYRKVTVEDVRRIRSLLNGRGYGNFTKTRFNFLEQQFTLKDIIQH